LSVPQTLTNFGIGPIPRDRRRAGFERVATGRAQERSMQVWIGFQRDDAYVHEWTGEVAEESDMGKAIGNAIGNAITAYMKSSGKPIWGTTILVDKA
jgi:hypothetical protein